MKQHVRLYTKSGRIAHLERHYATYEVLCGFEPEGDPPEWYGTGSQEEYDRAKSLPTCKRCVHEHDKAKLQRLGTVISE